MMNEDSVILEQEKRVGWKRIDPAVYRNLTCDKS